MTELTDPHIAEAITAARELRVELGIGFAGAVYPDLLKLTESRLDLPVCIMQMPDGIAGAYLRKPTGRFIFLQSTDYPTRQRFTLAHELGHHRLGHGGRVDAGSVVGFETDDPQEQQANYFASEFLMPVDAACKWIEENVEGKLTITDIVRIADDFDVSPPAALYRLSKGEFGIARDALDLLWDDIRSRRHMSIAEELEVGPGDDEIAAHWETTDEGVGQPRLPAKLTDKKLAERAAEFIADQRLDTVLRAA
ncbi:MAG: ImmA/IrrE family metallo-endopeptidase [Solirubrobacterales bacterium]